LTYFQHLRARPYVALIGLLTVLAVAGCGSSSNGGSSSSTASHSSTGTSSASVQKADAILAPYSGHASPFPVTTPLKSAPSAGTKIDYLDCETPYCGLILSSMKVAAKKAGVTVDAINAGTTASTVDSAFSTAIAQKPSAIVSGGAAPNTWGTSTLKALKAAKIPVIMSGITDAARYGVASYPDDAVAGSALEQVQGKLEAAYIVAHDKLPAHVLYVTVPALQFSATATQAFKNTLNSLCPSCTVSQLPQAPTALGTTAPASIVSYLQANPSTNVVSTSDGEVFDGLTPALKQANLKVAVIGDSGDPENLEDLKAGNEQANVELSLPVMTWEMVDASLRAAEEQPFTAGEVSGVPPIQVLTPKDVTFNPADGWTGYPDYQTRFASLWKR
jgi:ribose transport system substrate-binding protein